MSGPPGLAVDRATGILTWQPSLSDVGISYEVTVRALKTDGRRPDQTWYTFTLDRVVHHRGPAPRPVLLGGRRTAGLRGRERRLHRASPRAFRARGRPCPSPRSHAPPGSGRGRPGPRPHPRRLQRRGRPRNATAAPASPWPTSGSRAPRTSRPPPSSAPSPAWSSSTRSASTWERAARPSRAPAPSCSPRPSATPCIQRTARDHDGRFFGFGFDGTDGMTVTITREGRRLAVLDRRRRVESARPAGLPGRPVGPGGGPLRHHAPQRPTAKTHRDRFVLAGGGHLGAPASAALGGTVGRTSTHHGPCGSTDGHGFRSLT